MHELSLVTELLRKVQTVASSSGVHGEDVRVIRVDVGRLSGVEPEALQFAFQTLAPESPLANAIMEINRCEPEVKCRACGAENQVSPRLLVCGACGSYEVDLVAGRDFLLTSIDVEETDGDKSLPEDTEGK